MEHVREQVPKLTGLLTTGSYLIVLVVIMGLVPSTLFPQAPATILSVIPHLLAGISVLAIGTILAGVHAIRSREIARHRLLMIGAFGLFGLFLTLDLYRLTVAGPTQFTGPVAVERYIYLPLLAVHVLCALLTFPTVYYALLVGISTPVDQLPSTTHSRAGKIAGTLWIVTFGQGLVIYVMLHQLW